MPDGTVLSAWAQQYSTIIAVDFLFWDSTHQEIAASVAALNRLVASAAQAHVPLVLGDILELRDDQITRGQLNAYIHSACHRSRGCFLLGFDRLHQQAVSEGIMVNGRLYFYRALTADGLHLNKTGSDYVGTLIVGLLGSAGR